MMNGKKIKWLVAVLLIQVIIVMSLCSVTSAVSLTPEQLSQRISEAVNATSDIWWYSPNPVDREKVISLLSAPTRTLQNATFNPSIGKTKFYVEGYHFLIYTDFPNDYPVFSKKKDITTTAIIQTVYADGSTANVPANAITPITVDGQADFTYDSDNNPYYPYEDQSVASKFYSPIVRTFESVDQLGFKFQVDTSRLPVGKFQFVVKADNFTSAVIPFTVERENIIKLTDVAGTNPNVSAPTWAVQKRNDESSLSISGIYLNGKLDVNKQPISLQKVRLSMNFVNGDSVSADVYDGKTGFAALTSEQTVFPGAAYLSTPSDVADPTKRFNVSFSTTLNLTKDQLSETKKPPLVGGQNKISISFYAYEPGNPNGKLISTLYQDINVSIPAIDKTLLEPHGEIIFDKAGDVVKPTLDESSVVNGTYDLELSGNYTLVGNSKIKKIETFVAGNGDLFPKTIQGVNTVTYTYAEFHDTVTLNITKLKEGMHSTTNTEIIPVQVIVTNDQGRKYTMTKNLYFIKAPEVPQRIEPTDTIIVSYKFGDNPSVTRQELSPEVPQVIREIDCRTGNTVTRDVYYLKVEGLVLAGRSVGKNAGNLTVQSVQVSSNFNAKPVIVRPSTVEKMSDNDPDAVFMRTYYASYDSGVTNFVYKFSANLPIDFTAIKASGSQKINIKANLVSPTGKKIAAAATRRLYLSKLGEGDEKNSIRLISSPKKNSTILVPTVTRYNTNSYVTIPVSGALLDGNYVGFKKVSFYLDNKYMSTITNVSDSNDNRLEEISNEDLLKAYKGEYTNNFDPETNAPLPPLSANGVSRDRINMRFKGTIQIKNGDKLISKPIHNIIVRATTFDGRTFDIVHPIKLVRFKELHSPTVQLPESSTCVAGSTVTARVYDVDLDLKTVQYKWDSADTWHDAAKSEVKSQTDVSIPVPSYLARTSTTLYIQATDYSGRKSSIVSKSYTATP